VAQALSSRWQAPEVADHLFVGREGQFLLVLAFTRDCNAFILKWPLAPTGCPLVTAGTWQVDVSGVLSIVGTNGATLQRVRKLRNDGPRYLVVLSEGIETLVRQ